VKRSFGFKLVVVFVITMFMVSTGIGLYALSNMDDQIDQLIEDKLNTDLALSQELLNADYPGAWSMKGGVLYKGEYPVDAGFPFVEKIARMSGYMVGLYVGQEQLAACKEHAQAHGDDRKIDDKAFRDIQKIEKAQVITDPWHKDGAEIGVLPIRGSSGELLGFWTISIADDTFNHITRNVQTRMMVGSYVAMIVTSIVFYFLTKIISKPIPVIVQGMTDAEKGDLTVNLDIDTDDEFSMLGDKFNSMIKNLADLTRSVVHVADQVAGSADQLNAGAGESSKTTEQIAMTVQMVATGTEDQAKSIEQTSTTINELTTGIQEVANHAQDVLAAANEANAMAAGGGEAFSEIMITINKVAKQIQEVSIATEEMAAGAEQAVAAIQNVASISEETAASAQQVAAAAEEQTASIQEVAASASVLAQVADELRSLVRHFKVEE